MSIGTVIIFIVQMRHREAEQLPHSCTASKGEHPDLNTDSLARESTFLTIMLLNY